MERVFLLAVSLLAGDGYIKSMQHSLAELGYSGFSSALVTYEPPYATYEIGIQLKARDSDDLYQLYEKLSCMFADKAIEVLKAQSNG